MLLMLPVALSIEPPAPSVPFAVKPLERPAGATGDCEQWCPAPHVCAHSELDGGASGELCLSPRDIELDEEGYGCAAACDGGCVFTGDAFECRPSQPQYQAQTAGRVRAKPNTSSRITTTFEAGVPIFQLERKGDWVRTHDGWIHHTLLEVDFVRAPPLTPERRGMRGWVAGYDAEKGLLHEVIDT